ncbi:MAG: hypothetical protein ACYDHY_09680 [Acidiferrobacterales bacterium]
MSVVRARVSKGRQNTGSAQSIQKAIGGHQASQPMKAPATQANTASRDDRDGSSVGAQAAHGPGSNMKLMLPDIEPGQSWE